MDLEDDVHINKLPPNFIVKTQITENIYKIDIIEDNKNWSGSFSKDNMIQFAESLGLTLEDYQDKLRFVLTTHEGLTYCSFSIEGDENKYFICRKDIENTLIKSLVFKVKVEENTNLNYIDIIKHLTDKNLILNIKIKHLSTFNSKLISTNADLMEKLKKYQQLKTDMEEDLYGKFVLLLNEKKKKIRELQAIIASKEDQEKQNGHSQNDKYDQTYELKSNSPLVISDNDNDDDFMELGSQHHLDNISNRGSKN